VKTAIDTNILSSLLRAEPFKDDVALPLDRCASDGDLVIFGVVYAELCAFFERAFLDKFLNEMDIQVEEHLTRAQWATAGEAFRSYQIKRRRSAGTTAKRFLADFIVGAHAMHCANRDPR
jgi:predicted nucleic acid-binding protein